jgi:trehalose 6-phosphate synthase
MAAGCVVSSLHDGMNLVAKEFVAAREDERGTLVLSKFAGAAQELADAILVNPFDVEQLAAGLHQALTMPAEEQERRMRRLRAQVDDHNIYRWAGQFLSAVGKMVPEPLPRGVAPGEAAEEELGRVAAATVRFATHLA